MWANEVYGDGFAIIEAMPLTKNVGKNINKTLRKVTKKADKK